MATTPTPADAAKAKAEADAKAIEDKALADAKKAADDAAALAAQEAEADAKAKLGEAEPIVERVWVALKDFAARLNGQLLRVKAGDEFEHQVGSKLAQGGAPVRPKD